MGPLPLVYGHVGLPVGIHVFCMHVMLPMLYMYVVHSYAHHSGICDYWVEGGALEERDQNL